MNYDACPAYLLDLVEIIVDRLKHATCVDCGCDEKPLLNFDHVRGEKKFNIHTAVAKTVQPGELVEELDKCEVRCYNCHMRRHAKEWSHEYPGYIHRAIAVIEAGGWGAVPKQLKARSR